MGKMRGENIINKYYEIKVTIRESHPPTWRRLRIPANITFNDLAAIIEIAFEWCGYHLYEFEIGATLHEMGQFIAVPSEDEYGIEEIRGKTLDSGKEKIDKYFKKYKRMKFIYDFGGTYGYEEYYPNDERREELDMDFINDELEEYKDFAKQLYEREMF